MRMARIGWIVAASFWGAACGGGDAVAPSATGRTAVVEEELADDEEWVENSVPMIEWVRFEPESPGAGTRVTAQARVNDPDGDDVEVGYAWRVNGRPARSSGNTLTLGNTMKGDTIQVTVTATDGWDESDPVTIQTTIGNVAPVLQSVTFDPLGTIHRGQVVTARPIAHDADGDALEYEYKWWVNDRELTNTSDQLDTKRLKRGDQVIVWVVATDGRSRSNEIRSAPISVENSPPKIVSTPKNTGPEGTYVYEVKAEDPDGDRRLRFRLKTAPAGMTIDPIMGDLTWTPPADAEGSHPVEVIVDDLQGGIASQRFSVDIGFAEPEKPEPTPAPAAPAE